MYRSRSVPIMILDDDRSSGVYLDDCPPFEFNQDQGYGPDLDVMPNYAIYDDGEALEA